MSLAWVFWNVKVHPHWHISSIKATLTTKVTAMTGHHSENYTWQPQWPQQWRLWMTTTVDLQLTTIVTIKADHDNTLQLITSMTTTVITMTNHHIDTTTNHHRDHENVYCGWFSQWTRKLITSMTITGANMTDHHSDLCAIKVDTATDQNIKETIMVTITMNTTTGNYKGH